MPGRRLEPRDTGADVGGGELRRLVDGPGEKTLAEGAIGYETDPELVQDRQDLGFGLAPPKGVLALQGRQRLHGVSAADGRRRGLGPAEVLDLARPDEVFYRAGYILDGNVGVDTVLIEQIDTFHP